jgi:hypothetical protein
MNAPNSHRFLSGQLGRTSAPIVPHFVHTMRGWNDFTERSPGDAGTHDRRFQGTARRLASVTTPCHSRNSSRGAREIATTGVRSFSRAVSHKFAIVSASSKQKGPALAGPSIGMAEETTQKAYQNL